MGGYGGSLFGLQWGRGHVTAEGADERPSLREAAMGPRSRDRGGNSETERRDVAILRASMGPRSRDRGGAARRSKRASRSARLQWGRGHVTAEGRGSPAAEGGMNLLQW